MTCDACLSCRDVISRIGKCGVPHRLGPTGYFDKRLIALQSDRSRRQLPLPDPPRTSAAAFCSCHGCARCRTHRVARRRANPAKATPTGSPRQLRPGKQRTPANARSTALPRAARRSGRKMARLAASLLPLHLKNLNRSVCCAPFELISFLGAISHRRKKASRRFSRNATCSGVRSARICSVAFCIRGNLLSLYFP